MEFSAKFLTGVLTTFINVLSAGILFFGLSFSLSQYIPNKVRAFSIAIIFFNMIAVILASVSSISIATYLSKHKKFSQFFAALNSILICSIVGVILILSSWIFGYIILNNIGGTT